MPFKSEDKELIYKHMSVLAENTSNIESLTAELKMSGILTEEDLNDVMTKKTRKTRFLEFYEIIVTKDSRGFEILLKALRKFGQSDLANLLSPNSEESGTYNGSGEKENLDESSDEDENFNPAAKLGMEKNRENIKLLKKKFKEFDTSGDGKISQKEFYELMSQFGLSRAKSEKLLKAHDTDSDGQLNFVEFSEMFFSASTPDFFVSPAMKMEIIRILEDDVVLAERWPVIMREIVPIRYHCDVSQKKPMFNLIISILDHWTSNESYRATFDRLCEVIRKESPNCARILRERKASIARL